MVFSGGGLIPNHYPARNWIALYVYLWTFWANKIDWLIDWLVPETDQKKFFVNVTDAVSNDPKLVPAIHGAR